MKQALKQHLGTLLGAIALLWTVVLTLVIQRDAPPASEEVSAELQEGQQAVVAFVQGDSIQAQFQFLQELDSSLRAEVVAVQGQLKRRMQPLEAEAQELIAFAQGPGVTAQEQAMAQNRLMEIEEEVMRMQEREERALMEKEQTIQKQIAERLASDLEAFCAEKGIDIVVNWGLSGEGVLYGKPAFDVTQPLIAFMNARHAAGVGSTAGEASDAPATGEDTTP
jgi:Skp family chaperone for outer membrane proteins